jgi:hypothetical protein
VSLAGAEALGVARTAATGDGVAIGREPPGGPEGEAEGAAS